MTAGVPLAITVGYDGAACSRAALGWAIAQAGRRPSKISVLTVWATEPVYRPAGADEMTSADLARIVRARAAQVGALLRPDSGVAVSLDSVVGRPSEVLVDRSRSSNLLVVGLHGRALGGIGVAAGAVSRECLRESACPVVLIGPRVEAVPPRRLVVSAAELGDDVALASWIDVLVDEAGARAPLIVEQVDAPWSPASLSSRRRPDDLLVLGRASGPVPSLLLRDPGCPVVVVPSRVAMAVAGGAVDRLSDAS